jgi:hypothetical protein
VKRTSIRLTTFPTPSHLSKFTNFQLQTLFVFSSPCLILICLNLYLANNSFCLTKIPITSNSNFPKNWQTNSQLLFYWYWVSLSHSINIYILSPIYTFNPTLLLLLLSYPPTSLSLFGGGGVTNGNSRGSHLGV